MNIGIITFQRAFNLGAQMQMYALNEFLTGLGHNVVILDYHNPAIDDGYVTTFNMDKYKKFFHISFIRGVLSFVRDIQIFILPYNRTKNRKYLSFLHNNFRLSRRFEKKEDMPVDFDLLITGSDQVWNYILTAGRKPVYFLDNGNNTNCNIRKISYAASSEYDSFRFLEEDKDYICSQLVKFDWISTREREFSIFLKEKMGFDATTVLDPTFLLSKESFVKLSKKPNVNNYICAFFVEKCKPAHKLAQIIAKERGLKIVNIGTPRLRASSPNQALGPEEMLGYILYADVVISTSFHGTALSIIGRKDFYTVYEEPSMRINELLSIFGLKDRLLSESSQYKQFECVNYNEDVIHNVVNCSKDLLIKNLGDSVASF